MTTLWKRFGAMAGAAIAAADRTRIRLRDHGVYRRRATAMRSNSPFQMLFTSYFHIKSLTLQ